jgi:hypothetical protein
MSFISFDAGSLLHIAALFQIVGFLIVDQLLLRLFILVGTLFYLIYYIVAFSSPLWEAIFWSSIMGAANTIIICKLLLDRTSINMSVEDKILYQVFQEMTPGEFRRLVNTGTWRYGVQEKSLTTEDEVPENLYYIRSGTTYINKKGSQFSLSRSSFIGEVAFFLGSEASATVTVSPDSHYIEWKCDKLRQLLKKNPGIRAAFDSKLNKDMATKVAKSVRAHQESGAIMS